MSESQGQVGPYSLTRLLATGSQSQVWMADGPKGAVALKVARTDAHRRALAREAAVLALGPQKHLPRMLDQAPDHSWLALAPVKGSPIDQWCQIREIEDVARVVDELLVTLEWLHEQGLVHGDIKPANVLVDTRGHVQLIDLGLTDRPGAIDGFHGTLGYAAPELLKGNPPSIPASDLYGVGAMLYTCLTGRPPFVAADPAALTWLPLVTLPPPPSAFNPDLPAALDHLLLDLLARDPARRPATIDAVRDALKAAVDGPPADPVLGMLEERDTLRRAVVGASEGEPRVVVLYGPPGSGRRTLITEAVAFATREGLSYQKSQDVRVLLDAIRAADGPVVAVLRGNSKNAQKLATMVLREGLKALLLLHADRPLPGLAAAGAIEVTPAPLSALDTTRLVRFMGADEDCAEAWWRESLGLPIAVLGRIRAWRRAEVDDALELDHLPADSRRILELLGEGEAEVTALSERAGVSEHELLDHCEVLFAEALIEPTRDGMALRLADGVRP